MTADMSTAQGHSGATPVAIFPYDVRPGPGMGKMPLGDLLWPLGMPETLRHGLLRDLGPDAHLIFYAGRRILLAPMLPRLAGVNARISVLFAEPEAWKPGHYRLARWQHRRFFRILTTNPRLLAAAPNAAFFPFGSTWVPDWQQLDCTKSRMLSLIASEKRALPGHRLRHQIAAWLRDTGGDAAIMGRGYQRFERKSDGLAPFYYSLVIENAREPGYFTEKLVDAMLCNTVPIYWGAPDIGKFFDPRGMILCETEADMRAALAGIGAKDYAARLPYIAANRANAAHFAAFERRSAQIVAEAAAGPGIARPKVIHPA